MNWPIWLGSEHYPFIYLFEDQKPIGPFYLVLPPKTHASDSSNDQIKWLLREITRSGVKL